MKIKKFTAATMDEARAMVQRSLGKDAVILHTKKISKRGTFDLVKKEMIELTAALADAEFLANAEAEGRSFSSSLLSAYSESEDSVSGSGSDSDPPQSVRERETLSSLDDGRGIRGELRELRDEVAGLRTIMEGVVKNLRHIGMPALPDGMSSFFTTLVDSGVDETLSKEVMQRLYQSLHGEALNDVVTMEEQLLSILGRMLRTMVPSVANKHGPLIEVFVGPTGVGKTTTLAKLAMRRDLFGAKTAAIISADNYRLAATEQLKIFAGLIDVPLSVVYSPDEIRHAIEEHQDKDVILIDTAGRSQSDSEQFSAMKELMHGAEPDDVHLVLSATAKTSDLLSAFRRYQALPVTRIVFTKLDETTSLGTLFNFAVKAGEPISFVSFGQNIPEDIRAATSDELSRIILQNGI